MQPQMNLCLLPGCFEQAVSNCYNIVLLGMHPEHVHSLFCIALFSQNGVKRQLRLLLEQAVNSVYQTVLLWEWKIIHLTHPLGVLSSREQLV